MYAFVDQPVERLCNAARFLLWAMRGWSSARSRGTCPPVALCRGFSAVNARCALPDFNMAMALLGREAAEPFVPAPMGGGLICEDEAVLLGMWRDAALGDCARARATLALVVPTEAVSAIVRAMTATSAKLISVGFDLTDLSQEVLKEMK